MKQIFANPQVSFQNRKQTWIIFLKSETWNKFLLASSSS